MAFKLDFDRLSKPWTDEEHESYCKRIQDQSKARIKRHSDKVMALYALIESPKLSEWERGFIRDMHYKATSFGMESLLGEPLLSLTPKQIEHLERLHTSYCEDI